MSSRPSLGTFAFAVSLFFTAGCMTFSSADEARVIDGASGSGGENATTFGAAAKAATIGSGEASGEAAGTGSDDGSDATPTPTADGSIPTGTNDPDATTTVGTYLNKLGSAGPKGTLRTQVIDTVIRACDAFAPPARSGGWQRRYCWAHLASEMLKESSYNPASLVMDSYATRAVGSETANDPTVGLLQIRFSSVVHDFVAQGPTDRLSFIGCTLPASLTSHKSEAGSSSFWAVTGPTANRSLVQSVACNVGFGAWYVYMNATGNGKSTGGTYLSDYCAGKGTTANLVTGFRAFLEGPTAAYGVVGSMSQLQSADGSGHAYINAMKTTFDAMVGAVSGTHPFFLSLSPSTKTYCR